MLPTGLKEAVCERGTLLHFTAPSGHGVSSALRSVRATSHLGCDTAWGVGAIPSRGNGWERMNEGDRKAGSCLLGCKADNR